MFNRFRRKENQSQNVQVQPDPEPVEKQQGFICPMCMTALPGPAELQAHFEKVHDEGGGGGEPLMDNGDDTDALPENNEELLSNISKGSLEIALDSNAPDTEKVVILLRQELSDVSVELKEEKWYTAQLKTELEKVSAERDRIEEEKALVQKEYMAQLRSAEEGYFEVVEENKKLQEGLVFADYNVTKERHDKLKQQVISSQNEADKERQHRAMLEEDNKVLKEKFLSLESDADEPKQHVTSLKEENKTLREQVASYQSEIEEERLRREGLQTGINLLKQQVASHQTEANDEKQKREAVEKDILELEQEITSQQTEASEEKQKRETAEKDIKALKDQVDSNQTEASQEKDKREADFMELKEQVISHETAASQEKQKREAVENDIMKLKDEKEKVETELHKVKDSLEQEIEKSTSQTADINGLQDDLNKEKEKISVMEKEHAEQLTKMEKGDQGAVIQELSLEKAKLLESIAAMETSMTLKLKEHSGDIVNIRQEKMKVMVELRGSQLEKGRVADELQSSNEAKEHVMNALTTMQQEKEKLKTKLQEIQDENEKVKLQLQESEKEKEKMKEELGEGNEEKEIIMNELRKCRDEVKRVETLLVGHEQEINVGKEEISTLNMKIKDYETSNANLNGLVTQKDDAINDMKAKHFESTTSIESQIEEERKTHLSEIDAVKKENERVTEEVQKYTEQLNSSKEEVTELNSKIVEYEAKNNTLESSLQQKEDILCDVHSKLEASEQELQKPCDSCRNYEVQLCRLQEETKDSQGDIVKLQKEFQDFCDEVEEEKRTLNSAITMGERDKLSLEESENASNLKITDMEVVMEGLNSEKELFRAAALQAEEKISVLDNEKSNLKKELRDLKVELLSQAAEKEEIAKELEEKEVSWINERNLLLQEAEDLNVNIQKITTEFGVEEQGWIEEKVKLSENIMKEDEAHQSTKNNYQKVEDGLRVDIANLQRKVETSKQEHRDVIKSKEELHNNLRKIEQDLIYRTKEITEYEKRLKSLEHDKNELKGDVNVLEVQLQSANEEKAALLERVLATEDQHKKTKQRLSEGNRKIDQSLSALQELGQENQNLQVQQVLKSNRQWLLDNECESCKKCDKSFSFTNRKHHCRHCGFIFCGECSCYSAVIASNKKAVRVCEACSMELSSLRGSNVRRLSNTSSISSVSTR